MDKLEYTLFNFEDSTTDRNIPLNILLEQYKLYVETMEKVVARRQTVNSFFLAANTFLITLSGFANEQLGLEGTNSRSFSLLGISISGILLSTIWLKLSRSYGLMNAAKFEVIHALERKLPAALFLGEWIALGEGKDPRKYQPMSKVESRVTWVFIYLYIAVILWAIYNLIF
ncbi:hypothetical protein IQ260_02760 [Leptolyngbya cf. ectocarpi LEGE 11479]|uniref:Small integral membrane protein n=2 Tax=Leptolyngbya ectocarpi TaxID=1202 RepID=A0A928X115_LEPEC|nr:hypothetical protein [Leptolyngbya cf. ectocarpi LEGE 11479]